MTLNTVCWVLADCNIQLYNYSKMANICRFSWKCVKLFLNLAFCLFRRTYRGSFFRRTALADSATWYLPGDNGNCDSIPAQVNSGTPDICALVSKNLLSNVVIWSVRITQCIRFILSFLQSNAGEERCICIKLDGYGVYLPHCGKCVDPCALKFVPSRRFPRRKNAKLTEADEAFLESIEKWF